MISHEHLLEILRYDPDTGDFVWLGTRKHSKMSAGDIAGTVAYDGYRRISISGKKYFHHRLAFFYMTGRWPEFELDHKDLDRANNKWDNLREATCAQNKANRRPRSGLKGAFSMRGKNWYAMIQCDGKRVRLGTFATEQEAHEAYMKKLRELRGEFARCA